MYLGLFCVKYSGWNIRIYIKNIFIFYVTQSSQAEFKLIIINNELMEGWINEWIYIRYNIM